MKLTESFLSKYKDIVPDWGYEGLGWVVYQRTYSRPNPDGSMEEWWQTVQRVVEGSYQIQKEHCEKNGLPWNGNKAQRSAQKMYDLIFSFKFLPPGRGLWAMGTEYVKTRGSAALNNCAFISTQDIRNDFSYPFCFLMDMSMLGVGVGADTRGAGSCTIKEPSSITLDVVGGNEYIIKDSREGWVDSVRVLLESYSRGGTKRDFNYSLVRPAGATINGFGGISSGPEPLQQLHESLVKVLDKHVGKTVDSTLIVDIFNMIGRAVAAGGIRRSAEIMLGYPTDKEFIQLKDPALHPDELKSHRWTSNNSLIIRESDGHCRLEDCEDCEPFSYENFVDQIMSNGEPGFFWIDNARNHGRMKDEESEAWDQYVMGQNPCGEISLESGEFCNLVELYPASFDDLTEFLAALRYAYLYAKSVSLMPTHNANTNAIIGRNRRLGISVSGVVQAIKKLGHKNLMVWLDEAYRELHRLDQEYSRWLCVPTSRKLTTVKPSGTVSLLTGATPGVHYPHSEYYLRRVRFHPNSPLLPVLEKAGYPVEASKYDDNTMIVSFPIKEKYFTKGKSDVTMWEQFELAAQMQYWWADNSVSVTVHVRPEEKKDVAAALSMYESRLKSVSLLPLNDHGYEQAPYQEISEAVYKELRSKIKTIKYQSKEGSHDIEETGCTNDTCSII